MLINVDLAISTDLYQFNFNAYTGSFRVKNRTF